MINILIKLLRKEDMKAYKGNSVRNMENREEELHGNYISKNISNTKNSFDGIFNRFHSRSKNCSSRGVKKKDWRNI